MLQSWLFAIPLGIIDNRVSQPFIFELELQFNHLLPITFKRPVVTTAIDLKLKLDGNGFLTREEEREQNIDYFIRWPCSFQFSFQLLRLFV